MISDVNRDYYAGALVGAIGLGAAILGARYQIGTLTNMGPGFMPTALGILLAILGVAIAVLNARRQASGEKAMRVESHGIAAPDSTPDWWGWGCIISGVVLFILLANYAGLLPATFFAVFVSARGDRTASWQSSLLLAAAVTVFGIILFSWLLQVQMPIIRGF
jgi:hypothetical protein